MSGIFYDCTLNGVPILSNHAIDMDAVYLLKNYNPDLLKAPGILDVDDFAEFYLNLRLYITHLSHCGYILGRMVFEDTDAIPVYDMEEHAASLIHVPGNTLMIDASITYKEHLYRSTVMHECGHFRYHRFYFTNPYNQFQTACRTIDDAAPSRKKVLVSDADWLEHQAQYFAGAILMPYPVMMKLPLMVDVRNLMMRCRTEGYFKRELSRYVSRKFGVSYASARIRLEQLGIV